MIHLNQSGEKLEILGYGKSSRLFKLIRNHLGLLSVLTVVTILVLHTEHRSFVNYRTGQVKNSTFVAGFEVHESVHPIYGNMRSSQDLGYWELMTCKDLFGGHKDETSQAAFASSLIKTLEMIAISDEKSKIQKLELTNSAWAAAESHNSIAMQAIQLQADDPAK